MAFNSSKSQKGSTMEVLKIKVNMSSLTRQLVLSVLMYLLIVQVSYLVSGSYYDLEEHYEPLQTDKRYARLSYNYGPRRSHYGYGRSYGYSRYTSSYFQPWKNLRDYQCSRKTCKTSRDCCRRFNICDKSAKLCINCWYGYPCKSSRDCCERFPYCNKHQRVGMCQN